MNSKKSLSYLLIILGVLSRFLPHYPNVTPLYSVALFSGSKPQNKLLSVLFFFTTLLISDIILNKFFYNMPSPMSYLVSPVFLCTLIGHVMIITVGTFLLRKTTVKNVFISSGLSAFMFYIFSNFGCWIEGSIYSLDFNGLLKCYTAGLPFLKNTFLSIIAYNTVIFGVYYYFFEKEKVIIPEQKTI